MYYQHSADIFRFEYRNEKGCLNRAVLKTLNTSIFVNSSNTPSTLPGETANNFIKSEFLSFDERNNVYILRCEFDNSQYHRKRYNELGIPFPNELKNATTKRQMEFLAGRYIAHKALRELCFDISHIPRNEHGAPVWPDGVVASVSHTNSVAVCAASLRRHNDYLGVDIENWISPLNTKDIMRIVIDSHEEYILSGADVSFESALTIAFSAKESFFKALYSHVGKHFNFEAAKIYAFCMKEKSVTLIVNSTLSPLILEGKIFECKYSMDEFGVMTLLSGKL